MTANIPPEVRGEPAASDTPPRAAAGSGQSATWVLLAFLLVGAVLVYLLGYGR